MRAGRSGAILGVAAVGIGVAGLLAGCSGPSPAAQEKAACQKYCGQITTLVNTVEKDCPDPGTLTTATCVRWVSRAVALAGEMPVLPDPADGYLSSAKKDLESYQTGNCERQTASSGANTLTNCEQGLEETAEQLYLAREDMATEAIKQMPPTAADFTWTLRLAAAPLNTSLARLRHASTSAQVSDDLTDASAAAAAASTAVGTTISAPRAATRATTGLTGALTSLYSELLAEATSGTSDPSCGVAASTLTGLAAVGKGTAYSDDLPKAISAMTAAGYPVPLVLPVMPTQPATRPANGTLLKDTATGGQGTLSITGSTGGDALVELVSGHAPVIRVYVRQRATAHVNGIPDGTYDVYTATGAEWDGPATSFTRQCQFDETNTPLNYQTTATTFTEYTLTIDAVAGGNTTVTPLDSHDFPR